MDLREALEPVYNTILLLTNTTLYHEQGAEWTSEELWNQYIILLLINTILLLTNTTLYHEQGAEWTSEKLWNQYIKFEESRGGPGKDAVLILLSTNTISQLILLVN